MQMTCPYISQSQPQLKQSNLIFLETRERLFVRVFPEPHFEQQQDPGDEVAHGALCDIL